MPKLLPLGIDIGAPPSGSEPAGELLLKLGQLATRITCGRSFLAWSRCLRLRARPPGLFPDHYQRAWIAFRKGARLRWSPCVNPRGGQPPRFPPSVPSQAREWPPGRQSVGASLHVLAQHRRIPQRAPAPRLRDSAVARTGHPQVRRGQFGSRGVDRTVLGEVCHRGGVHGQDPHVSATRACPRSVRRPPKNKAAPQQRG